MDPGEAVVMAFEMAEEASEDPEMVEQAKDFGCNTLDFLSRDYLGEKIGVVVLGLILVVTAIVQAKGLKNARIKH